MKLELTVESDVQILMISDNITSKDVKIVKAGMRKLFETGKNKIILEVNSLETLPYEVIRDIGVLSNLARDYSGHIVVVTSNELLKNKLAYFAKPPMFICCRDRSTGIASFAASSEPKKETTVGPATLVDPLSPIEESKEPTEELKGAVKAEDTQKLTDGSKEPEKYINPLKPEEKSIGTVKYSEPLKPEEKSSGSVKYSDSPKPIEEEFKDPLNPLKPIDQLKSIDTPKPSGEPKVFGKSVDSLKSIEAEYVKSTVPVTIGKPDPLKSAEPEKLLKPVEPGKLGKPSEPGKPFKPAEPGKLGQPGKPVEPGKLGKPVEPFKPLKSLKSLRSAQPTESAESGKPLGSVKSLGSAKPLGPLKPAGQIKAGGKVKTAGTEESEEFVEPVETFLTKDEFVARELGELGTVRRALAEMKRENEILHDRLLGMVENRREASDSAQLDKIRALEIEVEKLLAEVAKLRRGDEYV
ncbi:MAG: hypothetical protein ABIQ95_14765 [Bdellovibrionia bacterium]